MKKNIFYLVLIFLVVGFWWYRYKIPASVVFPSIAVENTPENITTLGNIIHGPAMIHFYATWCVPCMRELPALRSFADNRPGVSGKIYMITDDSWEKIKSVQEKMGENIRILRTNSLKDLGIHSIPVTYFLDADLISRKEQLGACPWQDEAFLKEIQPIIQF